MGAHRGSNLLEEDSDVDLGQVRWFRGGLEWELLQLGTEVGRRWARDKELEDICRAPLLTAWVRVCVVGLLVGNVELVRLVVPAGRPFCEV